MDKPVKIPDALEARIDAKLDAFKGEKNDDTTHRRIAHVIEEELLQWQREHPRFVIPTPHVLAEDRTIRIDYTEHRGDESKPAPPPTIDAVRFLRIAPAPAGPELPPEPIVPSALVFTVCRGHALAVDWHGTDLRHWIDDQGMRDTLTEIDATARPDGVYVWRGKIRSTYYSHTGEHDSWLEGKVEPLADDELEQLATNNGDPWDEDAIAAHVEWTFKVSELERTDIDRVKEALTDYAHATGRRVQPVHEVAAACDQDRREAVAARDAALEELVEARRLLSIPGGMTIREGLELIVAGVRRVHQEIRGLALDAGARAPDDGSMTTTDESALSDEHVKAKADEVLALLEREPAQHMTTEILAREVRRLRRLQPKTIAFATSEVICELVHRNAAAAGFNVEHPVRALGIRTIAIEPLLRLLGQGDLHQRMSAALANLPASKYEARDLAAAILDALHGESPG